MEAINQVWLVGNILLSKGLSVLQQMKSETDTQIPYLCENYDIFSYFPAIADRLHRPGGNPLLRLVNSLVEAMNQFAKLPKLIITFLDLDLIKHCESKHDMNAIMVP